MDGIHKRRNAEILLSFALAGATGVAATLLWLQVGSLWIKAPALAALLLCCILLLWALLRAGRKAARARIAAARESALLQTVLDAAPFACYVLDAGGNWRFINHTLETWLTEAGQITDRASAYGQPCTLADAALSEADGRTVYTDLLGRGCRWARFPLETGDGTADGCVGFLTALSVDGPLLEEMQQETGRVVSALARMAGGSRRPAPAADDGTDGYLAPVRACFAEITGGLRSLQSALDGLAGDAAATARALAGGDLDARVPAAGTGPFADLAGNVNEALGELAEPLRLALAGGEQLAAGGPAGTLEPAGPAENVFSQKLSASFAAAGQRRRVLSGALQAACRAVEAGNFDWAPDADAPKVDAPQGAEAESLSVLRRALSGIGKRLADTADTLDTAAREGAAAPEGKPTGNQGSGLLERLDRSARALEAELPRLRDGLEKVGEGDADAVGMWAAEEAAAGGRAAQALGRIARTLLEMQRRAAALDAAASAGDLQSAFETDGFDGVYGQIMQSMGHLRTEMARPGLELLTVLEKMVKCNLAVSMTGDYQGDYKTMADQLNAALSTYNDLLYDINKMAKQVLAGTKEIAQSAQELSGHTAEQASAIEQLNVSMNGISSKVRENAESAARASSLAVGAKGTAVTGNDEMKEMLVAMNEIDASSENISKVIKVIDDIAFQTNILALNAAVEAARAGEYGKGFAVVAEEVRNLAGRCANAAQETTHLIEGSLQRVEHGTGIANRTSAALSEILENNTGVDSLVEKIAGASHQQAQDISQIKQGIEQVSGAVQLNSATSETSAVTCRELTGKAETLKGLIDKFWIDYRGRE